MQSALRPIEDYREYLKEKEISEDKASAIVDGLLSKGYYEETYQVTKTLRVVFRTRQQQDTVRLQTALQIQRPLFDHAYNELVTRYNMASSLSQYRDTTFPFSQSDSENAQENAFSDRLAFIERLPTPVFGLLSIQLAKFDALIMAVARPGVAENF
ncbi:MAG: hypothetical protein CMK74_02225 [Pseudomonadales bacterium]|nr:hypothetical protein [Pseudomonadales bacterium]